MKDISPYFTAGEFARICSTTKETLYHYERLGLLQPAKKGTNGYRYYHAFQFYDFDVIAVLKEAGSSLKEIKEYLRLHKPADFLAILQTRRLALSKERRKLERMEQRLSAAIDVTRQAIRVPYSYPQIVYQKQEYLLAEPIGDPLSDKESALCASRLYEYCDEIGAGEPPMGVIVGRENLLAGDCRENRYFMRLGKAVKTEKLLIRPAGRYLVLRYKGRSSQAFDIALSFIAEKKLRLVGDAYCYELIGYQAATDENDYVVSLSIAVE